MLLGIVALADVQQPGQTANGAQIQVIEAVLSACQGQHHGVLGGLLDELGVVVSAGTAAVAAAYQEEVPDLTGLHRIDHSTGNAHHGVSAEAGHNGLAAIDTGESGVLIKAAQFQSLFDERGEILAATNMLHVGIAYNLSSEYTVCIAFLGSHQTVGGKEDGSRQNSKFLLLILPCGAEVALQMGELFQFGIGMGRQHFAVGVDVDAFSLGLLQQQLEVVEVVAGDDDKGTLFDRQADRGRLRMTEGLGIFPGDA